jgi:hypothetical protein
MLEQHPRMQTFMTPDSDVTGLNPAPCLINDLMKNWRKSYDLYGPRMLDNDLIVRGIPLLAFKPVLKNQLKCSASALF